MWPQIRDFFGTPRQVITISEDKTALLWDSTSKTRSADRATGRP
jgi:hypothetical protein